MRTELGIAILLLATGLTGCIGPAGTTADPGQAPGMTATGTTLPTDLTMDNAEVVTYNQTTVTWRWEGLLPAMRDEQTPATAAFTVPAGISFELRANATWETEHRELFLRVVDENDNNVCGDGIGVPGEYLGDPRASCRAGSEPATATETWRMEIGDVVPSPQDEAFVAHLTLSATGEALPRQGASVDWATLSGPDWRPGDWWEIELTNPVTENTYTFTTVVAAVDREHALLGTARPPIDEILFLQATPLGRVSMGTLTWNLHDRPFKPLHVPLMEGAIWTTTLANRTVEVTVRSLGDEHAELGFTAEGLNATARYDPRLGMLTEFHGEADAFAAFAARTNWRVVDHGSDHEGPIYVPMERSLAFRSGKAQTEGFHVSSDGSSTLDGVGVVAEGRDVANVPEGPTHLVLGMFVGWPAHSLNSQAGAFHEHVYLPDGKVREATVYPHEVGGVHVEYHTITDPAGEWVFEHYGAGPGVAMSQGVAYTLVKYDAPGAQPEVWA
ncbi:MAG: hypothetical protein R3185_02485 [Candidatus Thermoplasmatota archaeon]|nr:hypothetical protein [Candidatus Thermoplasmatota archaeon]